jgi:CDP-4-dehydro-6-deoxyglucose reductase
VLGGETITLQAETGLTGEEKAKGWILSCVRSAEADVVLESEDLGGIEPPTVKTLPCRIGSLEKLAPDVLRVVLRLPPTAAFTFITGQYIDIIGPDGLRRSYSLASAQAADKTLELHIRAVDGGAMSAYWFGQAKVNDLLRLNGPLGTFFQRKVTGLDLVFLATGTGIAPVKAILESIRDLPPEQLPGSVTVLWGGRVPDDLYIDIAAIGGGHRYVPVLSRADESWTGSRGHVQDVLLGLKRDLANAVVYACGSDAMIHSAQDSLLRAGLPANRFYSDAFVCSAPNSAT